jgi:hypothetical protein
MQHQGALYELLHLKMIITIQVNHVIEINIPEDTSMGLTDDEVD